jgi:hypothetical protein
MGEDFATKIANLVRAVERGLVAPVELVAARIDG